MNICGSNLIPIFITFLCCGAVFIYFSSRLNEVKFAVEKQNRVLTSFITNVQQDIRMSGTFSGGSNNLATPEAFAAAQKFENEKIVVSDDEDDSDSDSESDSDEEEEDIKTVNMQDLQNLNLQDLNIQHLNLRDLNLQDLNLQDMNLQDLNLQDLNLQDLNLQDLNIEQITFVELTSSDTSAPQTSSITEITDESANLVDATAYEQMRVDDLRRVASDKHLASKEEVKKLKKPELLQLLKK
jgi:uncharacterized protein YjbI with pentapeptide repeats